MHIEADLVKACQQNDAKAQTTFYNLYKSYLFGICIRYAKSKEEAEDIFQEAFARIFEGIKKVKNPEAIDYWVKQVVVNTAINYYKKHLKFNQIKDYEYLAYQSSNQDHLKIMDDLTTTELLKIINELPDGYRVVFNLYVIDGYTHPEISKLLGITASTSKSQLSRAKELIRSKLKKCGITSYEKHTGSIG